MGDLPIRLDPAVNDQRHPALQLSCRNRAGVTAAHERGVAVRALMTETLARHHDYIRRANENLPDVRDWTWPTE